MTQLSPREKHRRSFLKYLAASPVLTAGAKSALAATAAEMPARPADPMVWWPQDPNYLVTNPEDALDVFELEAVAHKNVPPSHFGFVASGADDDGSVRANRQDISKFALRGRRLRDVRQVDTSMTIFNTKYSLPFYLCPVGYESAVHQDGVLGALRASGRHNCGQMLSTYASATVASANQARNGTPVFFQLYNQRNWEITKSIVQRAEREGAKMMAFTIDNGSARKDTQFERSKRFDSRLCATCHEVPDPKRPKDQRSPIRERPVFSEISDEMLAAKVEGTAQTWELVKRLRDITKMELFLKGVMHPDDADMAAKLGYGVYVSNHGGRNEDTSASTISALPDIVSIVKKRVPIFIDGGFRRGMDIAKALCLGATMVGFGRPWMWGLGAFGEAGVDRVIQIMKAELIAAMQQLGAQSVKDLNQSLVYKSL